MPATFRGTAFVPRRAGVFATRSPLAERKPPERRARRGSSGSYRQATTSLSKSSARVPSRERCCRRWSGNGAVPGGGSAGTGRGRRDGSPGPLLVERHQLGARRAGRGDSGAAAGGGSHRHRGHARSLHGPVGPGGMGESAGARRLVGHDTGDHAGVRSGRHSDEQHRGHSGTVPKTGTGRCAAIIRPVRSRPSVRTPHGSSPPSVWTIQNRPACRSWSTGSGNG